MHDFQVAVGLDFVRRAVRAPDHVVGSKGAKLANRHRFSGLQDDLLRHARRKAQERRLVRRYVENASPEVLIVGRCRWTMAILVRARFLLCCSRGHFRRGTL